MGMANKVTFVSYLTEMLEQKHPDYPLTATPTVWMHS